MVSGEGEHADAVGVRVDARQRLGLVAVDVHGLAVGAHVEAGILGVVLGHASVHHRLHRAGFFTADQQNLLLEDFAGAVLGAGDEHGDFRVGQIAVELGPAVVRVGNDLAVLEHLRADGVEDVGRLEFGEGGAGLLAGEHDAVIADAHFYDVGHAVIGTGLDLFFADGARGVGNVDGVLANAFTEALEARGRAARFDNRCREIGVVAKKLGHDRGVGQNGGRAGDLDVVAGSGAACSQSGQSSGGNGGFEKRHGLLPEFGFTGPPVRATSGAVLSTFSDAFVTLM